MNRFDRIASTTNVATPTPKAKGKRATAVKAAPKPTKRIKVAPPAVDDEPSYEPAKSVYEKVSEGFYRSKLPWAAGRDSEAVALRKAYGEDNNRLHALFKKDLFEAEGVTGNPKADRAFSIAWDQGHHSGYSDVANYFSEIVELIKG